jgi:hypothetical protein
MGIENGDNSQQEAMEDQYVPFVYDLLKIN